MSQTYCVYLHKRPDGSVFYVGKGVVARPHRTDGRNKLWKAEVDFHGNFIADIVIKDLTEDEAFAEEIRLIKEYRDSGIILTNQTKGGDGCKSLVFTDDVKEKLRAARAKQSPPMLGKKTSDETKKILSAMRSGKNNPMYGKKHTEETKAKFKFRPVARPWLGKKFSESHIAKMKKYRVCPHCGLEGHGNAMTRWHFDNCKRKLS